MRDNKTSQSAVDYDVNVGKTIPYYTAFHEETIQLVKATRNLVNSWLDTGCGTGNFVLKAKTHFQNVKFVAADPSAAMLEITKEKLDKFNVPCVLSRSENLTFIESFDVVTAILAHHYLSREERKKATQNCYTMLKDGGIYITFETIQPNTTKGIEIGLQGWKEKQLLSGKSADAVESHINRYGTELLPITVNEHIELLKKTGFTVAEILWVSGMQAGFYAIK